LSFPEIEISKEFLSCKFGKEMVFTTELFENESPSAEKALKFMFSSATVELLMYKEPSSEHDSKKSSCALEYGE